MTQGIHLDMLGRTDSTDEKSEYYFTRPNIPCLIDLSKCVIFVRPYTRTDGTFGAEMTVKTYRPPDHHRNDRKDGSEEENS